jgi:hypothetical protein
MRGGGLVALANTRSLDCVADSLCESATPLGMTGLGASRPFGKGPVKGWGTHTKAHQAVKAYLGRPTSRQESMVSCQLPVLGFLFGERNCCD